MLESFKLPIASEENSNFQKIRDIQNNQVSEIIDASPYLEECKDILEILRSTEGWMSDEEVPVFAPSGKILISNLMYDGAISDGDTRQYKIIDEIYASQFEKLLTINEAPDFVNEPRIEKVAPLDQYEIVKRITSRISEMVFNESEGFENWNEEEKIAFVKKWGINN